MNPDDIPYSKAGEVPLGDHDEVAIIVFGDRADADTQCPGCGVQVRSVNGLKPGQSQPEEDALSVCQQCACVAAWTAQGALRALTAGETLAIFAGPLGEVIGALREEVRNGRQF